MEAKNHTLVISSEIYGVVITLVNFIKIMNSGETLLVRRESQITAITAITTITKVATNVEGLLTSPPTNPLPYSLYPYATPPPCLSCPPLLPSPQCLLILLFYLLSLFLFSVSLPSLRFSPLSSSSLFRIPFLSLFRLFPSLFFYFSSSLSFSFISLSSSLSFSFFPHEYPLIPFSFPYAISSSSFFLPFPISFYSLSFYFLLLHLPISFLAFFLPFPFPFIFFPSFNFPPLPSFIFSLSLLFSSPFLPPFSFILFPSFSFFLS